MILIFYLLKIIFCHIESVQDQTRLAYNFYWNTDNALGVLSQYCPLGINNYLYEQSNEDYYYFLQNAYVKDKDEMIYLIYMEIQFEQRLIVFHIQFNLEGRWVEGTFPFKSEEVEGIFITSIIYYSDLDEVIIEQIWGDDNRRSFTFSYTYLPNLNLTQISGGQYSDINPITNNKVLLKQFPGKMLAAVLQKQDFKFLSNFIISYQGSNQIILSEEDIHLQERVSNQLYTISTQTQQDYNVSFWAKTQESYDSNFDQILHILRVVANRFTQDFLATGSNSFVLDYVYNKQTQKWIQRINFYSYIIPVLVSTIPDNSMLTVTKDIIIDNYSYINTWHYVSIQYSNHIITFYFENPLYNYIINYQYENVYQYSLIYYRLFFGGTILDQNSLTRSFALLSFKDYTGINVKCHSQCQTCFGPLANNCWSCPPDSNRIYQPKTSTCQCQLWYLESFDQNCKFLNNEFMILKLEETSSKENLKMQCYFGEFEHNDNCYKCPSAGQDNQIICSACLMRPTNWIYNNPACYDIYYQYENNPDYQYLQMMTDQELSNQYYIFQNDELQPCQGCKLCQDKLDSTCQLSSYLHLDKETYIQCLQGYYFSNGICLKNKQNLDIINISCQNNCLKCSDGQCQICSNNINFFINYMGECQVCAIKYCKYCFQYNSLNLIENTILRNRSQKTALSDDFEVGCALCLNGYIYSFRLKQCLPQYHEIDCQSYIDQQDVFQCYSTKFDQLITKFQQITNCQEQLSNCEQCIYTKFSILVCIKCSQGFYINKVNGLCNKCVDHQASDCQLVDSSHSFQKLNLFGFLQYSTQNLNDLSTIFNDFDHIDILECKQNFILDTIQNQCIDSCTNCDKCAIINGQQQCLKCTIQPNQSNFYSQKQGNCYQCPQLCKLCLPIDLDLIQQYNPYFLVTESSKTQAMKCLINYDQNLTYIDYRSGLIKPLNIVTHQQLTFSAYANELIRDISGFDDIIQKSVSKITLDMNQLDGITFSLLNLYYSLNNVKYNFLVNNNIGYANRSINVSNSSEVRIYQLNIDQYSSNYNINSYFGVNFYAEVITGNKLIPKSLFTINQPLLTNLTLFNIYDIIIQDSQVITVNSDFQNSTIILQHFLYTNSTFIDSIFLLHTSKQYDSVFISNLTFINCTFQSSVYFSQKTLVNINIVQMSLIKFINCTLKNSFLFQVSQRVISFSIQDFQVINCSFYNSSLISGLQNLRMDQVLLNNLILIDSNLFLHTQSTSNQTIIMTHLICSGLFFNKSTILLIENLQENIQIDVIIQYWNLEKINLKVTNQIIIDNSILKFYNVNSQIKDLIIQKSILFTLLIFQNCQEVILNNIQITQIENEVQSFDTIDRYKQQRYAIYISEFTYLTINQLQILHWIQTSASFLIIRSDSYVSKLILISQLYIEYYSSYNIFNYIDPAIFIQIDAEVKINITNGNFKRCNFWSRLINNQMMEAALIKIKSPKSQVIFNNLSFQIANVYNSSHSIIVVDATTIYMLNLQVDDINNQNTIGQLYSQCGFVIFMAEQIRIINTILNNINSAQYGFIYNQMKQQGSLQVQNCVFNNTKLANTNFYLTQLGGVFTIDGRLSYLQLSFINITAINIYAQQAAAFLYLIPSSISNQIFMQNLTFKNLISADNLFCKLKFPSNSQNNKIVIDKIFINNKENSTILQWLIGKFKKGESGSNYEGLISSSFSSVSINDFTYEGYLTQPIFKLNVINSLKISNLKFVSLSILNQIEYVINIEIQNSDLVIMQNFYLEKMYLLEQLEYFFLLNYTSVKHPIISNSIYFIDNLCPQCQNGFITIINNLNQSKVIMSDYIFYNNNCGLNSCLIFQNLQLRIHNSMFINNLGQNNGILQGIESQLLLKNSILKNNQILDQAGAIFLNQSIFDAQNLIIVNNSAKIGGAIFFENSKLIKQTRKQILFQENYGIEGLNNIREQADFLKLNMYGFSINNKRQIQNDQIYDTPSYIINHNQMKINDTFISVASGQKLNEYQVFNKLLMKYSNYTISLQIEQYTQLGEKIITDQGDQCLITQYQVNSDLNQTNQEILSQSLKENITLLQFDKIWESYKLDNFSFYLDPYYNSSLFLLILVKCDQMPQNYNFIFKIKTLPCGIGEYYTNKQCLKCDYDKGYYSVRKNSNECQRLDPTKMKSVTSYQIELLQGFWRYSYYSHYIVECENSATCLGGWNVNYESCSVGYIGAICNECDIYNIRGQSSFIKSLSGICQKKERQIEIFLITLVLMLFIFVITYVVSLLKSDMHLIYKRRKYMTMHYRILFQCEIDQLNTSLKLLINFMQILYPTLPPLLFNHNFADIAWPIGKSSKTLLFFINFLAEDFQIEIPYLKMVWSMLIPIIQIAILILFYTSIKRINNNSHIQQMFIQASCIFLLFYSMPNIIEELTIVIQKRTIVNIDWIGANLAYQYQTQEHLIWIWQFVIPSICIIILVIPILFFTFIFKKHKQTNFDISYGIYGYLCSDYKKNLYFWELITLEIKLIIIFILFYLDNDKMILKNLIIIFILLGYYTSISTLKPFSKQNLNHLEKSGIILCCVFITLNILQLASYKYSYIEVQYLTQILMLLTILLILFYTIHKIIITCYNKYQDLFDRIRIIINKRFPNLINYCSFFKIHLKLRSETRKNTFDRFKRIKSQLRLMKLNNIKIIRNSINIHDDLVTNILRSDHRQLIPQYSIHNSFMF